LEYCKRCPQVAQVVVSVRDEADFHALFSSQIIAESFPMCNSVAAWRLLSGREEVYLWGCGYVV
jgi:hypothetical protein